VVLGTIPQEIPVNVRIDSQRTGVKGLWYAPNIRCAQSLNRTLAQYCTPAQNCYLVDLKKFVDDLNCGMKVKLKDGSEYSLFELRPDGIHQSDAGARAIAERIIDALEQDPIIPSAVAAKN
jgi:lysophospholipase L1-like esterase